MARRRKNDDFIKGNAEVVVGRNESLNSAIRRFNAQVEKSKVLETYMEKMRYEKPSDKKRKAKNKAKYLKKKGKKRDDDFLY